MPRARQTEQAYLERRRRERETGGGVEIDLAIHVTFAGETLLAAGGRWDRRMEAYTDEAENALAFEVHPGQARTVRWFRDWLCVHAGRRDTPPAMSGAELEAAIEHAIEHGDAADGADRKPDDEAYAAMLGGGRRGGKTWVACLLCAIYAVQFPGAIVWIVNPSDKKHDEVRRYMAGNLAAAWIAHENARGWELVNGSAIMLKSAYAGADPDAIKEGEAHLVLLNEGQKQQERIYVVARGATIDSSGLVLVCANPPVQAKDQPWVTEFALAAQRGRRDAVYHHFSPLDNPHINRRSLLALRREVDLRTFRIEALGEFLASVTAVAYNWERSINGNERSAPFDDPAWRDVTGRFLSSVGLGDRHTDIAGMDFQVVPWMGGPVYRIYCPADQEMTAKNVVMWAIDEVVIQGDELEWCALAQEHGLDPQTTLIIGDGTGEYQHSRRGAVDAPPPEWHGKGSFDMIRMGGYPHIIRPDPRIHRNNPHVVDRVRAMTSLIETADHQRRLFIDPDRCPKTVKAIREWPTINGRPSRTHEAAHLGDGLSYPIVRLFPRKLKSEKNGMSMENPILDPAAPAPPPRPSAPAARPAAARIRRGRSDRGL